MSYHKNGNKYRNTNSKTQISAITGLKPYSCIDTKTGETISPAEYEPLIISLVEFVQKQATILINQQSKKLDKILSDPKCPKQAVGACQRYGISGDNSKLGKNILSKYRINRLIMHKAFTEYKSYFENEDPNKKFPTLNYKINLGAIDKQMASLSFDQEHFVLVLQWKCWARDITLFFSLPKYIEDYNINKFCMPTIQYDKNINKLSYYFSVQENLTYREDNKNCCQKRIIGGYDLGLVEPFVLTVMTDTNKIIATRKASYKIKELNNKRERILSEKNILAEKLKYYDVLKTKPHRYKIYEENISQLACKASKLGKEISLLMGAELAELCVHHNIDELVGENLTWVSDENGSSKWMYGKQQGSVCHSVRRSGTKHFTVSPKNSSKTCVECGSLNTKTNSKTRVVKCVDCSAVSDRDVLASRNLAAKKAVVVNRKRMSDLLVHRKENSVSSDNSWCPDGLAACWGKTVGDSQVLLSRDNTAFSWSSQSLSSKTAKL